MFQKQFDLAVYIVKHQQGDLTDKEQYILDSWLAESDENRRLFADLNDEVKVGAKLIEFRSTSKDPIWEKTKVLLGNANFQPSTSKAKLINWRIWMGAAATLIVALGLVFYTRNVSIDQKTIIQQISYIQPGQAGATLTLANGKRVRLSDAASGTIAQEGGVSVSKSTDGQLVYSLNRSNANANGENTLSTSNGETYQIRLHDGTKVWLNAGSSLTYTPRLVNAGKRRVKLVGEAYFEVAKDKLHPFIVSSNGQEVEVLGTQFNVNAYLNETNIKTTLLEGKIKIIQNGDEKIIDPGQQAVLMNNELKVQSVNVNVFTAWKNGYFDFTGMKLAEVFRQLERWYDVDIQIEGKLPEIEFYGKVLRDENWNVVWALLETNNLGYILQGKKIIVFSKGEKWK
jgi:ferric-dicitrate binding protein FerR (iron transport regulator)